MRVGVYVQGSTAKANYKNECFNSRFFAGVMMVRDAIIRLGTDVGYASAATVSQYDIILVSITSDCDWWPYITERLSWPKGNYTVIVGGAGVLNVRPFLAFADIFVLGRGEEIVPKIIEAHKNNTRYDSPSVVYSDNFDPESRYEIAQSPCYPYPITIGKDTTYFDTDQGCPNKCLYCSYAWHRKHQGGTDFTYHPIWKSSTPLRGLTMIDILRTKPDPSSLRITAIDGFSERLRFAVNKRITDDMVGEFIQYIGKSSAKPHQIKIYNIVNYPTESHDDWKSFKGVLESADSDCPKRSSPQFSIILHSTPFRPMPCTPVSCWPMKYENVRGEISKVLGASGNAVFYRGNSFFAVESMGTESLSSVILSAIAIRGIESDAQNIVKLCKSKQFWAANTKIKQKTLERYFDTKKLFGSFHPDDLPTNYLQTYVKIRPKKSPLF